MTDIDAKSAKRRWRLALGRYSEQQLGGLSGQDQRADQALDYLYGREYQKRGLHRPSGAGSLDPTQMRAIDWLDSARKLFPKSVFEVLQDHALDRYGLSELLEDADILESLEPNQDLLKVLLGFHGRADPATKAKIRQVAQAVIDDLIRRLKTDVQRAFSGRRNPFQRSRIASAANFDWHGTLRRNLKNYDPKTGRIIADDLRFISRNRRNLTWSVVLCVDQSGSMINSIIHSAVMATILSGLPGVKVSMVLFDTSIIDVTDRLSDPIDTLLSVQLGGGTDIGRAVEYCERYVETPERTAFVLISDFAEGTSPQRLYRSVARMNEAKVKLIGLSALDEVGDTYMSHDVANRLATLGMHIGAMTPDRLAHWLAEVMR